MTFEEAQREAIGLVTAESADPRIAPGSRTIVLTHGAATARVVLLLHGFTNAPPQFAVIARRFHDGGANVLVPRMPHHGYRDQRTDAVGQLTMEELLTWVLRMTILATGLGQRVDVGGESLGGLLAAWLAQYVSIGTVFPIAPLLGIVGLPAPLLRLLSDFVLRLPDQQVWWDPLARADSIAIPPHAYSRFSTHVLAMSILSAQHLLCAAESRPSRAARTVFLLNPRDKLVDNRAALRLADAWREHGANVTVVQIDDAPPMHDIVEPWHRGAYHEAVDHAIVRAVGGAA